MITSLYIIGDTKHVSAHAVYELCNMHKICFKTYDIICQCDVKDNNFYFIVLPYESIEGILQVLNLSNSNCIIMNSTLQPKTCKSWQSTYSNLNIILCNNVTLNMKYVLLGVSDVHAHKNYDDAISIFKCLYSHIDIPIYIRTYEECELFKYALDTMSTIQSWYFNEMNELATRLNIKYDDFRHLFYIDTITADMMISQPCSKQTIQHVVKLQESLGISNNILQQIENRNKDFLEHS